MVALAMHVAATPMGMLGGGAAFAALDAGAATDRLTTVETVAGPGYCPGNAIQDRSSTAVRALAVDPDGVIHVTTALGDGLVARVDADGQTRLIRTGIAKAGASSGTLAPDGRGGVLMAAGTRVVQVGSEGVTTLTGVAAAGPADRAAADGDGADAGEARFRGIRAVATDASGNLYVADEVDSGAATVQIRFVNRGVEPVVFYGGTSEELTVAPGTIETIAGLPGRENSGDGGAARRATIAGATSVLTVAGERLYLGLSTGGTQSRGRIRVINMGTASAAAHGRAVGPGEIQTIGGASADDFSLLSGITADEGGNLFLADQPRHRVLRLDPSGVLSTVAGTGGPGFDANANPASESRLDRPSDVKVGPNGRVYIADEGNGQVRFVERGLIHAALGNGLASVWTCQGRTTPGASQIATEQPQIGRPSGVAADDEGNVYVALPTLGQVKRVDRSGLMTTLAGTSRRGGACPTQPCAVLGDGGPATDAELGSPTRLAVTASGRLYIFDQTENRVRMVNLTSRTVRAHGVTVKPGAIGTVAGRGRSHPGDDVAEGGSALEAELAPDPGDIAADAGGNLFIADRRRVRQVAADGRITTIIGTDGSDPSLCCVRASGLAVDADGDLYVGDWTIARVWFLNRGTKPKTVHGQAVPPGAVRTVAGGVALTFAGDGGPALEAQLDNPRGMAVDGSGNLYIAQGMWTQDHAIRMVDADGTISTPVGAGSQGFNGDGLAARRTTFTRPADVAVDGCGNLLIADEGNDRVRRVRAAACQAAAPAEAAGHHWWLLLLVLGVLMAAAAYVWRRAGRRPRAMQDAAGTAPEGRAPAIAPGSPVHRSREGG